MYRFSNRGAVVGVIENVWCLPAGTPFRIHEQLEIIGTQGSIYVHGADTNLMVQNAAGIDCPDTLYWPQIHDEIGGALRSEIGYFVDCVGRGMQSRLSLRRPKPARCRRGGHRGRVRCSARTGSGSGHAL